MLDNKNEKVALKRYINDSYQRSPKKSTLLTVNKILFAKYFVCRKVINETKGAL